jgi:hypothetical protein
MIKEDILSCRDLNNTNLKLINEINLQIEFIKKCDDIIVQNRYIKELEDKISLYKNNSLEIYNIVFKYKK